MIGILQKTVFIGVVIVIGGGFYAEHAMAQTDGSVNLRVNISDLSGNGTEHWTLVWVTKADGTFINTLRKQGNSYSWTSSQWNTHTPQWNTARAGSTVVDGLSGATATTYSGVNNPVILTWSCRDKDGNLMPDGDYKFWIQYAEDSSGAGPYTTAGLLWTKGAGPSTTTYPNQGSNFSNMEVVWSPVLPPNADITSINVEGSAIIITGTGTVSATYTVIGTTNIDESVDVWTAVGSGSINGAGGFSNSIPIDSGSPAGFYRVVLP